MERGFKYRIYPNESQRDQIARTLGCCRFVYNRALDVKKSAYAKTGKAVSWAELSRMLPAWKRDPDTSWLAQVDSMALQQSIRDLDRAYKNFFRRVREGGKPGFPKFKSRRHSRQSYRTNGGKVVDRNHIALPKLGTVRAKVSRPLQGRFMSVTVSLDAAGRYFATFLCTDVPTKDTPATDRKVGIDLGVETLATLSDGRKIGNPRHLKKYERKLAREQRRLSRRKGTRRGEKPSGRYLKQRKRVARIHAKIADARTDTLHKVTTMLADENQVLCMEDLNAKGMMRNCHLAKAVSNASFGEFARLLEYKCAERGRTQAQSVDSQNDELPFTYFRPIRDRLYSWGFDAIKDAQAVMYLGRGDYDSYQIARNDLEDSGWLSPEIEINSLDKIPLGEYLQAGISKMKSTDWA